METAISLVETNVVMTQTAIPTATFPPPTNTPPDALSNGRVSSPPADRLDYAMATAPKIYSLYPYINEETLFGEYSGCVETNDFQNFVGYAVRLPMEVVNTAFMNYFQTEGWEFTETTSELATTTYDVYRISSDEIPAFERLGVSLRDESAVRGENYLNIRIALTHVETKENFRYLLDPFTCYYYNNTGWLWIRLYK